MEKIHTLGNRCFVSHGQVIETSPTVAAPKVPTKPKSEKVNLKHGKIRVQVTGAKKVRVLQDGAAMVLILDELL